ncbi:MAG: hypothetical protein R3266_07620, partial [Gemmatimonadota bacterium]|nr:hypothetical protein [Gemmatimonadota bacterium]
ESGLAWAIVRPSWAYGPDDASLNRFVTVIRTVPFVFPQIGSGQQRINPIHIDDVSELAARAALDSRADGHVLEAGGPQTLTLDEIVRAAMRRLGREKPILHVPLGLVKLAAGFLELFPGQVLSRDAVDFVTQSGVADISTARRCFADFDPRDLERGLAEYLG